MSMQPGTCHCGIQPETSWTHCKLCGREVQRTSTTAPAIVRTAPSCLLCDDTTLQPCYLLPVDVHTTVSVHVACLQAGWVNMKYNPQQKQIYLEVV